MNIAISGNPTAEEVAAVVTVLFGLRAQAARSSLRPGAVAAWSSACAWSSAWADPAGRLGQPLYPGPDTWRRSALPS